MRQGWYRMKIDDEDQVIDEQDFELEDDQETKEVIEDSETSEESEPEAIQDEEDEEDDRIVTIGDAPEEDAEGESEEAEKPETPKWVKTVRKNNRRLESEVKRLKRELEAKTAVKEDPVEVGKKPELKDFNYDDSKFADALLEWNERKRKVEAQAAEKAEFAKEQQKAWEAKRSKYVELKQEHAFKDYDDTEQYVANTLNDTQQGIIVQLADDSALLTYALGKNPKALEELAGIKDSAQFIYKLAKVEAKLKVSNKSKPSPESRVKKGKGSSSGNSQATLERLEAAAAKSGDYTEVVRYKRKLRQNKG